MKKLFLAGLIGFSINAIAETQYVNADILNVRDFPIDGEVIGQLSRGDSVDIYESSDDRTWSNISDDEYYPMWVSNRYLCSGDGCYQVNNPFLNNRTERQLRSVNSPKPSARNLSSTSRTQKKTTTYFYGGSCPCSGSYNCTGPRGGTYCYTNSGKKRYR
ncbi:SH3 domain-containing protein [Moraxella bovoculi]|uniref:SH3 domain-containing protein n=1 Tax=Moraxella bovoculi TaxID=386891 RepID=UPI000B149BA5|nr:SH3 domain-containing protein [Moraxella bovoculi]